MVNISFDNLKSSKHFLLVKDLIRRRSIRILRDGYIRRDGQKVDLDSNCSVFLKLLLKDNFLENIICSPASELSELIDQILKQYPDLLSKTTSFYKIVYNTFIDHGYNSPVFDKLEFINNIGKDTCLYCNRNYIYTLNKVKNLKPEIDHFYPKGIYPFLALTYSNLIPSCEMCNGFNCKGDKDPKLYGLTNPYLIKDSDFKFSYSIKTINVINPLSDLNSVNVCFKSKLQPHLDVFKLDKLYEKHTDHLLELIIKGKLKYTEHYRMYLKSYKTLKFSDNEINRMIIGNYIKEDEIHRRPLAKLYKDIAIELGLAK